MFDVIRASSDAQGNLDYAPGGSPAEFSRWFAGIWVDIVGEVLYNIDRLMSGNCFVVVDWKGCLL